MQQSAAARVIANLFEMSIPPPETVSAPPLEQAPGEGIGETEKPPRSEAAAAFHFRRKAKDEARSLARMIGQKGETAQSIREIIRVDVGAEKRLLRFAEERPSEADWMLVALRFRKQVMKEFDALVQAGEYRERVETADLEAACREAQRIPLRPILEVRCITA